MDGTPCRVGDQFTGTMGNGEIGFMVASVVTSGSSVAVTYDTILKIYDAYGWFLAAGTATETWRQINANTVSYTSTADLRVPSSRYSYRWQTSGTLTR
mgnify:FL=1